MKQYLATPSPVEGREVVEQAHTLLSADTTLADLLGGTGRTYAHRLPEDKPEGPWGPEAFWARLLIAEPSIETGSPEGPLRILWFPLTVVAETANVRDDAFSPDLLLAKIHARVFAVLVGQKPAITTGTVPLPIERAMRPTSPVFHRENDSYYSAAQYRVTVHNLT